MLIPTLIGIAVLSLIVLAHEVGHFITAKLSGVKVEEFGLGLPLPYVPRLVAFRRGETLYSINVTPFGGFNKLSGEEDPNVSGSLAGKKRGIRLLVLGAGSLMNIFLALILFSAGYLFPRPAASGQVEIAGVAPNSPAAAAGIKTGDIVLSINAQPLDSGVTLHQLIMDNLGKEITLLVQTPDSASREVRLIPRVAPPKDEGAVGIAIRTVKRYPFWMALPMGATELVSAVVMWVSGLVSLFTGNAPASEAAFIGPVGLVQLTGEVAVYGPVPLLELAATISLILGIMNLLPLPAIDGGRITFLFLEWLRKGKRISPKSEGIVHLVGLALLMFFIVAITIQDVMRLISGQRIIPP